MRNSFSRVSPAVWLLRFNLSSLDEATNIPHLRSVELHYHVSGGSNAQGNMAELHELFVGWSMNTVSAHAALLNHPPARPSSAHLPYVTVRAEKSRCDLRAACSRLASTHQE
jgi:hypothetical protein